MWGFPELRVFFRFSLMSLLPTALALRGDERVMTSSSDSNLSTMALQMEVEDLVWLTTLDSELTSSRGKTTFLLSSDLIRVLILRTSLEAVGLTDCLRPKMGASCVISSSRGLSHL